MPPEIKVQTFLFLEVMFFSFFRASSEKLGQKWCLKFFDFKKCAQNEMNCSRLFEIIFFGFFSGKVEEIWAKSLAPPKIYWLALIAKGRVW